METAILMDHISLMPTLMELVTVSCVCYLVLLLMMESGLLLVDHQLTVTLILFVCNVVSSPANISLYKEGSIASSDDGWYKCCLPTNCSDPNTNMITANIFSKCSHCTSTHCYLLLILL